MAILGRRTLRPLPLVLSALLIAVPPAQAENLFEVLFGGWSRRVEQPLFGSERMQRPIEPAPRIASPTYYDYKADPLVEVDFTELQTASASRLVGFEPKLAGAAAFHDALATSRGFDLRAEKDIAKALVDYYSANPEFIWVSGLDPNSRAVEAVRTLDEADTYGLIADEYSVPLPRTNLSLENTGARLNELFRFEMTLSARVLR